MPDKWKKKKRAALDGDRKRSMEAMAGKVGKDNNPWFGDIFLSFLAVIVVVVYMFSFLEILGSELKIRVHKANMKRNQRPQPLYWNRNEMRRKPSRAYWYTICVRHIRNRWNENFLVICAVRVRIQYFRNAKQKQKSATVRFGFGRYILINRRGDWNV